MLVAFWLRVSSRPATTTSTGKGSRWSQFAHLRQRRVALRLDGEQQAARAQGLAREGGEQRRQPLGAAGDGQQQRDAALRGHGGRAEEAQEPEHAGQPGEGGEQGRDGDGGYHPAWPSLCRARAPHSGQAPKRMPGLRPGTAPRRPPARAWRHDPLRHVEHPSQPASQDR